MRTRSKGGVFPTVPALVFALMLSGRPTQADDHAKSQASSKQKSEGENTAKAPDQPILLDLKPISTTEAVRSLAQEMAKGLPDPADKSASGKPNATGAGQPDSSAVVEFQPAPHDAATDVVVVTSKDSKQSVVKNVHGSVEGLLDPNHPGNHQAAASAGASSKSGKTSVYVETDSTRAAPPPH